MNKTTLLLLALVALLYIVACAIGAGLQVY